MRASLFVKRAPRAIGATDDLRREWPQPASGVEKHRGYAFQWYALAALISALAALLRMEEVARAMKNSWRRYLPLYVLVAITIVPIAIAYISYYYRAAGGPHQLRNAVASHSGRYPICRWQILTAAASTCASWLVAGYS